MINPKAVTNFNRTPDELEEFLLFSIVVAGKGAFQQAAKLEAFLAQPNSLVAQKKLSPFAQVHYMLDGDDDYLDNRLRSVKMGQYNRIGTAFRGVSKFLSPHCSQIGYTHPLKFISVKDLQCIKGIGMKTARFFVMHTRPNQRYACLDTHVLAWLKDQGHDVPKSTPQGQKYLALEKVFLDYCSKMNMMPADLDLKIWNEKH